LALDVSDNSYVAIDIPIGTTNTSAAVPFIPLDAIYQTQDSTYVLVIKNGKAVAQKITTGDIFGNFAQITKGLGDRDQIITDRTIIAGDKVAAQ